MGSAELINIHKGERITLGLKRPNGSVFFNEYVLVEATDSHLFVNSPRGSEAILLSEIVKMEFKSAAGTAGRRF